MKKAQEIAAAIAGFKGSTGKEFLDKLGESLGMTGEELFEEIKRRRREREGEASNTDSERDK